MVYRKLAILVGSVESELLCFYVLLEFGLGSLGVEYRLCGITRLLLRFVGRCDVADCHAIRSSQFLELARGELVR